MSRTFTLFGILMLLVSCKSARPAIFDENIFWYDNLGVSQMIKIEQKLNSKDISEESKTVGFGISLYPNENKFKLQKPKAFIRNSDKDLLLKVFYQFSSDGVNRLILYEWNISDSLLSNQYNRKIVEKCHSKFTEIFNLITSKLGDPVEDITATSGRREVTWSGKNGLTVYLLSFGPNPIRLSVYRE